MRGHVRQRGKTWYYIVDVGDQKMQRCDCGFRNWVERDPLESCPKCGGELRQRVERRQSQKGGFRREKDAVAALTTVLGKLQHGTYVEPSKVSLRDYLNDEWLPAMRAKVKPSTFLSYETHVHRHINPALGNVPLQRLSATMLDAFYATLATEPREPVQQPRANGRTSEPGYDTQRVLPPLSPLTVHKVHATLHKALVDAVRKDKLHRNPADAADPPKTKSGRAHEMKTWTAKQLRAFLESTKETRLYPVWLILATTGMRRGEALGLRWEDVDMDNSRVSIRQNMVSVGYKVKIGRPKTGHGRNLYIDAATLAVLQDLHKRQLEEKMLRRRTAYVDSGLVFRQENGQPYHPDLISQAFQKAVGASGQPRIRLHDVRHTYATLALQAGIHPKVVSERLGHANISITLDIYSHAVPAMEEDAATRVAAMFVPV